MSLQDLRYFAAHANNLGLLDLNNKIGISTASEPTEQIIFLNKIMLLIQYIIPFRRTKFNSFWMLKIDAIAG